MEKLVGDCLIHIFRYLENGDLLNCRLVKLGFKSLIDKALLPWELKLNLLRCCDSRNIPELLLNINITADDLRCENHKLYFVVVSKGNRDSCISIHDKLELTSEDTEVNECAVLRYAAYEGNLDVCKWLWETFYSKKCKKKKFRYAHLVLFAACYGGSLSTCKWIYDEIYPDLDSKSSIWLSDALKCATMGGHLDICNWIYNIFSNSYSFDRHVVRYLLHCAIATNQREIITWLDDKYSVVSPKLFGKKRVCLVLFLRGSIETCKLLMSMNSEVYSSKYTVFIGAGASGDKEKCDWLLKVFDQQMVNPGIWSCIIPRSQTVFIEYRYYMIKGALVTGKAELCDYCTKRSPGVLNKILYDQDCRNECICVVILSGNTASWKWAHKHKLILRDDLFDYIFYKYSPFYKPCKEGNLELLEWISDTYNICLPEDYERLIPKELLLKTVSSCQLRVCKWLNQKFDLKSYIIREDIGDSILYLSAPLNQEEMCIWFHSLYPSTKRYCCAHVFPVAVGNGCISICQWLQRTYMFRKSDLYVYLGSYIYILLMAAVCGFEDVCIWLQSEFQFTTEEICSSNGKILCNLCKFNQPYILLWLLNTFKIQKQHIPDCVLKNMKKPIADIILERFEFTAKELFYATESCDALHHFSPYPHRVFPLQKFSDYVHVLEEHGFKCTSPTAERIRKYCHIYFEH